MIQQQEKIIRFQCGMPVLVGFEGNPEVKERLLMVYYEHLSNGGYRENFMTKCSGKIRDISVEFEKKR